jgi:peptidoglycan-N-acetylglucosamine deacetylase
MSTNDHRTTGFPITGALAASALAGYLAPSLAVYSPVLRRLLGVKANTSDGHGFALTFDDGPHAQGTPAVLEILDREQVRATFFLVGEQVRRDPGLAREIVAAGHAVGLHCDRHRNLLRLTPWQVREDIARAQAEIERSTGVSPELYRPPYGILNAAAVRVAHARGWRILLWSHWGRDWDAEATPASIAALVTDGARDGSVLLLHDADDYSAPRSWERTVAALPSVLRVLGERGLAPSDP